MDARYIIATYRAAILAPTAFHDPKRLFLKLLQDFTIEYENGIGEKSWLLSDVVRVVSIAAVTDEGVESTAGLLEESIQQLTTETITTEDLLMKVLESCPAVLINFRSQMVSQITNNQHLKLLAGEEVSLQMTCALTWLDNTFSKVVLTSPVRTCL